MVFIFLFSTALLVRKHSGLQGAYCHCHPLPYSVGVVSQKPSVPACALSTGAICFNNIKETDFHHSYEILN